MDEPRPLGPRVAVKMVETETPSGIKLPENIGGVPDRGIVVSVGQGHRLSDGTWLEGELRVGDEVLFWRKDAAHVTVPTSHGLESLCLLDEVRVLFLMSRQPVAAS